MSSFSFTAIKLGAVSAVVAGSMFMSSLANAAVIYSGQPKDQAGLSFSAWGSGSATESSEKRYSGEKSIKITTQGMYSGGGIEFKTPVTFNVGDPKSSEYLQFLISFNTMITLNPTGYTYGQAYDTSDYYGGSDIIQMPKVSKMRIVFVPETGKAVEIQQPVVSSEDDEGWPRINIPLAALKVPEGEKQLKVKKIVFFTDIPDSFYIGEISTITDTTPITCEAGDEQVVAANEVVFFRGSAEGGATTLLYSWDFDDKDGIQEDAGGPVVLHLYRKPGIYKATLTVRDANGLKTASTSTVSIEVND